MTDLDMLLNKAKLAEQAERYKDMKEVYNIYIYIYIYILCVVHVFNCKLLTQVISVMMLIIF